MNKSNTNLEFAKLKKQKVEFNIHLKVQLFIKSNTEFQKANIPSHYLQFITNHTKQIPKKVGIKIKSGQIETYKKINMINSH